MLCDTCGADISTDNGADLENIKLTTEKRKAADGVRHDVAIAPPISTDYYFCDLWCLCNWDIIEQRIRTE